MPPANTLVDVLSNPADSAKGIRLLQSGDREPVVSYVDLLSRAKGLLAWFQDKGLEAGDQVVLFVRNNLAFIDAFWACQLGGLVPVPVSAGIHSEYVHKLDAVARKFDRPFLFTERHLFQRLADLTDREQLFAGRIGLLEGVGKLDREGLVHSAAPADTALIQFSSGSTSEPKGVVLSHANLLANIRAIVGAAQINSDDVTLSWMPLTHDMGLIGFHLVPLFAGLDQVLMDTEIFVRRPARWLESAHRLRASLLCSPNFGYQHYLRSVPHVESTLDLAGIRLIFNGAEPVSAAVCREFAHRLEPAGFKPSAFFPVYGLAEASLAVTFPEPGSGVHSLQVPRHELSVGDTVRPDVKSDTSLELVCLGHSVEGCQLRIVDGNGEDMPDYRLGHVQIRGDNVTSAYYRCSECEEGVFVDGWLDTGDLGFMSEQGLFIAGRAKDVLFVSGHNWYSHDIERVLEQFSAIERGKVAVTAVRDDSNAEDLLLVFVQHRRDVASFVETVHQVKTAMAEHTGLHAFAVLPVISLPRTSSGKLQRYRLAQAFHKGEYEELLASLEVLMRDHDSASAGSEVQRQLLAMCQQLFQDQKIHPQQNLFELGADSLMLVRIHEEIEARFPGKVEITDLFDYPTIDALATYIEG